MPSPDAVGASPSSSPLVPHAAPRWTDPAWLDALRQHGDPLADACAAAMKVEAERRARAGLVPSNPTRALLAQLRTNDRRLPADAPAALRDFFDATYRFCGTCGGPELPTWVDRERLIRGQKAFMERSIPAILVMLCKSLPEGYAAPSMAKVLNMSGDLKARPYHRLMGTLQLLLDVVEPYSFERLGNAAIAGQEMRLLHAGVRTNVATASPAAHEAFVRQYGVPINQEDMIGTIIGFSLLVVEGLETLDLALAPQVAEDYYYLWRVFAHLMGVRVPGLPDDADHMPPTLAEARAFYRTYQRHYVGPTTQDGDWRAEAVAANPDGVALAEAHVRMLGRFIAGREAGERAARADETDATGLIDGAIESAGIHVATKYVHLLVGAAGCARIGLEPPGGWHVIGSLLAHLPRWWEQLWDRADPGVHVAASEWLFGKLVHDTFRQGVSYPVPVSVDDLHALSIRG
jgi:hypothetical protein